MKRKRADDDVRSSQHDAEEDAVHLPASVKTLRHIEDVAGRTWSTYRISPLHAFDEVRLDSNAEALRKHMAAESQRVVGSRWRFLSAAYPVARPDECGPIYAFVVGMQSIVDEGIMPEERPLLQAVLLQSRPGSAEEDSADNASYPVLLVRANKSFVEAFFAWFQNEFDCRVSQLSFNPYALARMAALWGSTGYSGGVNSSDEQGEHLKESLGLVYQAPEHIPEIKTIKLTIPAEDMRNLAATMIEKKANMYKEEEGLGETRPGLLRALEEHFFYHFRISLSAFLLCRISTPLGHLSDEGKAKLTKGNIPLVLQQLVMYAQHV